MKKILALLLVMIMVLSLAACGKGDKFALVDGNPTGKPNGSSDSTSNNESNTQTPDGTGNTGTGDTGSNTPDNDNSDPEGTTSEYYDLSRITASNLTIQDLGERALANAEYTAGEAYGDPPTAIYSVDYEASCLKDMDIFGYGVTVDEICGLGWGTVCFFSDLVGDDWAVQLKNTYFSLRLPMENKEDMITLATSDVAKFTALLNGTGDPYVGFDGSFKRGLNTLTEDMLTSAVDGSGSSPVEIFTSDRFTANGKEFNLSMTISSSEEDGKYFYCIGLNIGFFNN